MKKLIKLFKLTAIWIPPSIVLVGILGIQEVQPNKPITAQMIGGLLIVGIALELIVATNNITKHKRGKPIDEIGLLDGIAKNAFDEYSYSDGRDKAIKNQSKIKNVYDTPRNLVLGKTADGKYACTNPNRNLFVFGSSGSAKTVSSIITNLLLNPEHHKLYIDIKGELSALCADKNTIIFNPSNLDCPSYNPFWEIEAIDVNENEELILETFKLIGISLIPSKAGDTGEHFKVSARNIFVGLAFYYFVYKGNRSLATICRAIVSAPLKEQIQSAIEASGNDSNVKLYLGAYKDEVEENLSRYHSNIVRQILPFCSEMADAALDDHKSVRWSPEALEYSSIAIVLDINALSKMSGLVGLIINQYCRWIMTQTEYANSNRAPISLFIDELACIQDYMGGAIEQLPSYLRLSRSFTGGSCVLCTQSMSSLLSTMSIDQVRDLRTNCQYEVWHDVSVLSEKEEVIKKAGSFKEKSVSFVDGKRTISYSDSNILRMNDISTLPEDDKVVVFDNVNGFMLLNKCRWYNDTFFKNLVNTRTRQGECK